MSVGRDAELPRPRRAAGSGHYTSLDIALLAGVSQSTVSRALNGSRSVGTATRQRIETIARELDYHVDLRARHLRTQQTGALTLLMFADPALGGGGLNPFFLAMIAGITEAANKRGYDLIVSLQQLSDDWHGDYLRSRKSDGLILLGYGDYQRLQRTLRELASHDTRFVRWGVVQADQPGLSVGCDNREGCRRATAHLLALGRRRIAFLGEHSSRSPEFRDRYLGYGDAVRAAGLRVDPRLCINARLNELHAGAGAVARLLATAVPFDAVVAASDQIAISAMGSLQRAGIRVPEDVAVVGFDDLPLGALSSPSLTTVRQDPMLAGERLVATLVAQIGGGRSDSVLIPPQLIVRESCGAGALSPSPDAAATRRTARR
ncbi:LacI family DNA-binding transcriptional regulator [Pseudomarimonas salicorniae]|uniref:LacI family transcriptional regulator n=1 Tax=Pseudomarimonas salicorniae TaxID=2933270 RepID=A0ABT0GIE9_9GAMM|nr:LacI family DNA-binding transcriptional regulator [Lysobacter sp. CAU 1642]MCK7594319.1 LacI family transcriptional regulator [Lysobacter sp. CAU 1642]